MKTRDGTGPSGLSERERDSALEQEARRRLDEHQLFRGRSGTVRIEVAEGVLVLTGRLPSFYLKQALQTDLKHVPGIRQIENRVEVFG